MCCFGSFLWQMYIFKPFRETKRKAAAALARGIPQETGGILLASFTPLTSCFLPSERRNTQSFGISSFHILKGYFRMWEL